MVISLLVLAGVLSLVGLQWNKTSHADLYGADYETLTIWLVLASAAAGQIFLWMIRMLMGGMRDLRATRSEARLKNLEAQTKAAEKAVEAPVKAPSPPDDGPLA